MGEYKGILDFEKQLTVENRQEFGEEIRLAIELFNLFLEADESNSKKWQGQEERQSTMELINRAFNSLHASFKLILDGMTVQGMALLRDVIECVNHIKLFESDFEYRKRWCQGEVFFPRDVIKRLNELGIALPQLNKEYKSFSRVYLHPSKGGIAPHTINWYPSLGAQGVIYLYGGVKDIPRTRSAILMNTMFVYEAIRFLWKEMYPVDKETQPQWYRRLASVYSHIFSLKAKVDKEQFDEKVNQLKIIREIINDQFNALSSSW